MDAFLQVVNASGQSYPLAKSKFNQYLKLMQNEPYVCLAGSYTEKRFQINEWAFIKMKTRKGCVAYHKNGCHYDN